VALLAADREQHKRKMAWKAMRDEKVWVQADSIPKFLNLEKDVSQGGVVCEDLDLARAIE
jgi:hypothetical protein